MNIVNTNEDQSLLRYGEISVIAIVIFLALLRLPEPFWVDQVPFMLYAEQFAKGALLYRDFWDLKPPGIFGVYLIAGKLFGFTGIGMHLFDGLWMIGLAAMLRLTLAQYFTRSWIAILLPWLSAGVYFSVMDPNDQMQVVVDWTADVCAGLVYMASGSASENSLAMVVFVWHCRRHHSIV